MSVAAAEPPPFSCSVAASIPNAIGRSNADPSFLISAGARFTVMRLSGNEKSELAIDAPTRSLPSFTAP